MTTSIQSKVPTGQYLSQEHPQYGQFSNSLLRGGWRRMFVSTTSEQTLTSSWSNKLTIFSGEGGGITQMENLVLRVNTAPSSITGFMRILVARWNVELVTNLTASELDGDVGLDYRINIRERTIPVLNNSVSYETKFPRLRLRSDEVLAVFVKGTGGVGSKYSMAATASFREIDKGDL